MNWSPSDIAEAQALYDQGLTPEKVARRFIQKGKGSKLSSADVRPILNLHRASTTTPEQIAEIRRIRETEWVSYSVIAKRTGISQNIVERACVGLRPAKGTTVASARRTYTIQGQRTDLADARLIRFTLPEPVEVPSWVPEHLHELYEHTAAQQDEFVAARVIRDLKRGNSVSFNSLSRSGASDLDPGKLFGEPRSRIHPLPATGRDEGRHLHASGERS